MCAQHFVPFSLKFLESFKIGPGFFRVKSMHGQTPDGKSQVFGKNAKPTNYGNILWEKPDILSEEPKIMSVYIFNIVKHRNAQM